MKRIKRLGAAAGVAALTAALFAARVPAFAVGSEAPLPPKSDANGAGNMYGSTHVQNPMNSRADTSTSQTPTSQPSPNAATPSPAEEVALSKVENPQTALASATVQDSSGQTVGTAQKINTGKSGKAVSVDVALNTPASSGKTATIKASQLRYDQSSNTLKAKLSQSQIDAMSGTSSPQP